MDIVTDDEYDHVEEGTDVGPIAFANKSQYPRHDDDSNESTAPETEGSVRDNGEGPSRLPAAAGGSPDDGGDDSSGGNDNSTAPETEGSVRDNGEGPSRLPAAAGGSPDDDGGGDDDDDGGSRNSGAGKGEESDHDDNNRDLSVLPDVIVPNGEDEPAEYNEEGDPNMWDFTRLRNAYIRRGAQLDNMKNIKKRDGKRIRNLRRTIEVNDRVIAEKNQTITDLERTIVQLEADKQSLEDRLRGMRPPPTPWTQLWQQNRPYHEVLREACKQLNMSQVITNVHPQLTLSTRELTHRSMMIAYGLNDNAADNGNENEDGPGPRLIGGREDVDENGSDNESGLFVRQDSPMLPADQDEMPRRAFDFNCLQSDVQDRIFRYMFVRKELIHCLSRLDPGNRPLLPRVLNRFFWGGNRECCVTLAHRPNNVLRLLLVCKRWLYLGVHAFYGLNTFAFSSLGELGRFMGGIGSRMERIVNVELFWHGAILPRHETRVNQRTLPLVRLCNTRRLKTLVIHLQERDERRTRRKYEIQEKEDRYLPYAEMPLDLSDPFQAMMKSTRVQPNNRHYRSIRTIHGIDYVYQLRGMNYVRIREAQGDIPREKIRDWSVIDDINSVVTLPKEPDNAFRSELDNLTQIGGLGDFEPADDDMQIVRRWYADNDPASSVVAMDDDGDSISDVSSVAIDDSDGDGSNGGDDPDPPSDDDMGGYDSGVDVDMNDQNNDHDKDAASDSGVEDMDIDNVNDEHSDSESIVDNNDDLDNLSISTESSGSDDDDSHPGDTGPTGITSDYSMSANVANAGQSSRKRSSTLSSSTADSGDDVGDDLAAEANDGRDDDDQADDSSVDASSNEDNDDENEEAENGDNNRHRNTRSPPGLFVESERSASESLFVPQNRASTTFKTDSEEDKKNIIIIIDLTSDDNAATNKVAQAGDKSDASTEVKDEEHGSSGGGSPLIDLTHDVFRAASVSSSWKDTSSTASTHKRGSPSPYYGSEDQERTPKRMRTSSAGSSAGRSAGSSSAPYLID